MKKIFAFSAAAALCGMILSGCASTGAASGNKGGATTPSVPHPRTYTLDLIDSGAKFSFLPNQYGEKGRSDYQNNADFTSFIKADKPQAGDTIEVYYKATSDVDLDFVMCNLVDTSPAANYWTVLNADADKDQGFGVDVKAGVPFEGHFTYVIDKPVKGKLTLQLAYGSQNGKAANLTFERVAETTDTSNEVAPRGAKNFDIELQKAAALINLGPNLDNNGNIANYQAIIDLTSAFGNDLPKAGDTVTIKYKGTSDRDIPQIMFTLVENTAAVGWWRDLVSNDNATKFKVLAENVKAGELIEASVEVPITVDAVEGTSIQIFYDVFDGASGAFLKIAK